MKERYFKNAVFMQRQLLDRRYKVLKSQEPTPQRCRFLPHSVRWRGGGGSILKKCRLKKELFQRG